VPLKFRPAFVLLAAWPLHAGAQLPAADGPALVVANPNATFPAQQRALPSAEIVARGDGIYQVNCQACHGADLRGGDQGGPNLLRSEWVLNDVAGELIGQIVTQGRNRMPPIGSLDTDAMAALAGYIHSVVATGERQGAPPRVEYELDILVGDSAAGEAHFVRECTACHSATGDLRGIASQISDPVDLQNSWVAGRRQGAVGAASNADAARRQTIVTVTMPDGRRISGALLRNDDFFVSLRTADGRYRSFGLSGDNAPAVEFDNPLARHQALLAELTDDTMHDITAYLETLK
jgi:cytochrome c oxidase cbb3-type subunit 3